MIFHADPSPLPRRALAALVAAIALSALPACVSFDDAVATQGYVDLTGATSICARVFTCPGLATALRRSIAAPIDGENFSTCMSWLAGPSPTPPSGFAAQGAVLAQVAGATSCAAAAAGLDVVPIAAGDPLCASGATGGCTTEGDLFDCAAGQLVHCPGSQFVAGSTCDAAAMRCKSPHGCATVIGSLGGCTDELLCADDETVPATPQEQIVCSAYAEGCVAETVNSTGPLHHAVPVSLCTSTDNTDPTICEAAMAEGATACTSGGAMVICNHLKVAPVGDTTAILAAVQVLYHCHDDLGWTCTDPGSGSIPYCARPSAGCSPTDADVNTCDGDVLVACVAGESQRIDCSAVGASCHAGGTAFCAFGS